MRKSNGDRVGKSKAFSSCSLPGRFLLDCYLFSFLIRLMLPVKKERIDIDRQEATREIFTRPCGVVMAMPFVFDVASTAPCPIGISITLAFLLHIALFLFVALLQFATSRYISDTLYPSLIRLHFIRTFHQSRAPNDAKSNHGLDAASPH